MVCVSLFASLFKRKSSQDIKRRFYEGGKRSAGADFANGNAPFENLASMDRETLRSRARWLHENNSIISGIDHSIKVNAFDNGMVFQSKTGIATLDVEIEKKFNEWMKPHNCDITKRQHFYEMHSTLVGQRMTDGEVLIHKVHTTDKRNPLKLQIIEADRFDATFGVRAVSQSSENFVDGIELDSFGAPQKYILTNGYTSNIKVDASDIIHYYKRENRASQYRGMSEYKQIIIDMRNLASYQSSTIASLRVRSNIGYAIETDNIAGHQRFSSEEANDPVYDINGIMVHYLNRGEKIHMFDPSIGATEYDSFVRSVIRMIAVGRKVSYELAFRDYSQTNFSSARASLIQDNKTFAKEQWHFATYVLNPLFEEWLDANVIAGNIKGLSASAYFKDKSKFTQARWIAPAKEWVDPLKDIKAFVEEYKLGTATLSEFAASKGKDLEEIIKQREKEDEMLKNAGILKEDLMKKMGA